MRLSGEKHAEMSDGCLVNLYIGLELGFESESKCGCFGTRSCENVDS